jgi:hypothetical protein
MTQTKILAVHAVFGAALAAYLVTGGHAAVVIAGIPSLGLVALPLLRVFMHSQSH